jgi:hypothetical protein
MGVAPLLTEASSSSSRSAASRRGPHWGAGSWPTTELSPYGFLA